MGEKQEENHDGIKNLLRNIQDLNQTFKSSRHPKCDTMHKINAGDLEILHISKIIVIYHQIRLKEFSDHAENKTANAQIFLQVTYNYLVHFLFIFYMYVLI